MRLFYELTARVAIIIFSNSFIIWAAEVKRFSGNGSQAFRMILFSANIAGVVAGLIKVVAISGKWAADRPVLSTYNTIPSE